VSREGKAGLLVRALIVSAALVVATVGMTLARDAGLMLTDLPRSLMVGIALIVWISMMLGVIFSEYRDILSHRFSATRDIGGR